MKSYANWPIDDKQRLLGLLAAILVAGFTGTSVIAYRAALSGVRASIGGSALPVAAESVYARLQRDLVEPLYISSMMANDAFLHAWVEGGEIDEAPIVNYLREVQRRYGTITAFFVSERTRRYYHPSGILKEVRPEEWRDAWYWRVRGMDEAYEINIDPDLANADELTVFINYRVLDSGGEFLGAAGVGLTVNAMAGIASRLRDEFGTAVYFVDPDGFLVAGRPAGLDAAPAAVTAVPGLADVAKQALASGGGAYHYRGVAGETLLHVRYLSEIGWYLFVEREESASIAGSRRALAMNLALYGFILGLALLTAALTVDRYQRKLEKAAAHDPLTGALNRLAFTAVAEHAFKDALRAGQPVSVAIFDADDFKAVNDRYGHPDGDRVLKIIAAAATGALRKSDAFCRWGGEEFLCVLPGCDLASAAAVAEKLRAAVAAETKAAGPKAVTLSAGVAQLKAGEDLEGLIRRADDALLAAKRVGKDRVRLAE